MNNEHALSLFTVHCSIVISSGSEVMRRALRGISDWADLQWSLLYRALETVAPRARGKLLDVGCGDRQSVEPAGTQTEQLSRFPCGPHRQRGTATRQTCL